MKPTSKAGITGLIALALLTGAQELREAGNAPPGVWREILGIFPNFAAAIAIAFVLLGIRLELRPVPDLAQARGPFLACAAISLAGLWGWELVQLTSARFVFDPADLVATAAGTGVATAVFVLIGGRVGSAPRQEA